MSKQILKFEPDLDFVLVAVTAPLKDYQFCFKLNRQLNFQFEREDELMLQNFSDNTESYYCKYGYYPPESETEYYLLANKGTDGFLVPEMNKADFFMLIRNFIDDETLESMISGINKIPEVLAAIEVDPKRLKSKENLIF